jgi:hypothetical protein
MGDWTLSALHSLVASRPGWTLEVGERTATVRTDDAHRLFVSTGKYGYEATRYASAQVTLPASLHPPEAFGALVEALRAVGSPLPHRSSASVSGIRWRGGGRLIVLQRNGSNAWLAIDPAPDSDAAEVAAALHDVGPGGAPVEAIDALLGARPGWTLDGNVLRVGGSALRCRYGRVRLLDYEDSASLEQRRAAFGDLFEAVVAPSATRRSTAARRPVPTSGGAARGGCWY